MRLFGRGWDLSFFCVLKVPSELARREIVSLLKPRQVSFQEVSGVPKKCVGGCVGGNLVSVKKFVPNGLQKSYLDTNWKFSLSVSTAS